METHQEVNINEAPLALFSNQQVEADPFGVHAKMSYTSDAMVPTTSPQQPLCKTSKEENIIYSLQTQLTIQTELCGQYEVDLRARDEMVKILNRKIAGMDEEENRKKVAFETWQKKLQELERNVRNLEDFEDSMKDSVERNVTDERSGEALQTLHSRIADLQREKVEWTKVERLFKEEMAKLEHLAKEKEYEVGQFKELSRKEECSILRAELEAQWQHTEKASEKLGALEKERAQLNTENETLKRELATLNDRATSLEIEWQESEARRNELENELQAVWNEKETLEKDRDQVSKEGHRTKFYSLMCCT
jgi:chromosome segregation ATPase